MNIGKAGWLESGDVEDMDGFIATVCSKRNLVPSPETATLTPGGIESGPSLQDILGSTTTPHSYPIPAILAVLSGSAEFILGDPTAPTGRRRVVVAAGDILGIHPDVVHTMDLPSLASGDESEFVTRSLFQDTIPDPEPEPVE